MCAIEYYTYDDYATWSGEWELIYGLPLAMSPSPNVEHQTIAYDIAFELKLNAKKCDYCLILGETDWKINDDTVVKPDVVVVCNETNSNYITKTPEIIIEVISKSTAKRDEKTKFQLYQEERVPYYIIVYPSDLKAKIYHLGNNGYIKEGDFSQEAYHFETTQCATFINFGNIFKRFRR